MKFKTSRVSIGYLTSYLRCDTDTTSIRTDSTTAETGGRAHIQAEAQKHTDYITASLLRGKIKDLSLLDYEGYQHDHKRWHRQCVLVDKLQDDPNIEKKLIKK